MPTGFSVANVSPTFSNSVPSPADGLDEFFGFAIINLSSEPLDVNVNQIAVRTKFVLPDLLTQLGARKDPVW
jgi:hypothetical protein